MMPNPYHEYNRQRSAERVEQAYKDGQAKQAKRVKPRMPEGEVHLTVYGILTMWAIYMVIFIGLWVWLT
jgi:hypothetical protein